MDVERLINFGSGRIWVKRGSKHVYFLNNYIILYLDDNKMY